MNADVVSVKANETAEQWKHKPLLVAVRPENLQLADEDGQYPNTIGGKVVGVIYLGEAIKVKVATEAGEEITAKIPSIQSHSIVVGKNIRFGCAEQGRSV
jgi:putative spermidine/putrescine transport system ATP-binding protein